MACYVGSSSSIDSCVSVSDLFSVNYFHPYRCHTGLKNV